MVMSKEQGSKDTNNIPAGNMVETALTTNPHNDEVKCDKKIDEWRLDVVFRLMFKGRPLYVMWMKEMGVLVGLKELLWRRSLHNR